ncbi:formin-like protein 3, partial [Penaeus monodon]|uniref:formin-like protein 3 n=1 Tax=Penaeus monodon TaxID=6687 RepID=UPI0018A7AAAC
VGKSAKKVKGPWHLVVQKGPRVLEALSPSPYPLGDPEVDRFFSPHIQAPMASLKYPHFPKMSPKQVQVSFRSHSIVHVLPQSFESRARAPPNVAPQPAAFRTQNGHTVQFSMLIRGPGSQECPLGAPRTFYAVWRTRIPTKSAFRRPPPPPPPPPPPLPTCTAPTPSSPAEGVGRVFAAAAPLPPARPYLPPHVYPGSGAANPGASAGTPRHVADAAAASPSSSFLCRICSYTARDVVDLLAHNQQHKWDEELHHQQSSSEARPQRIFKCPYCDVQVQGRRPSRSTSSPLGRRRGSRAPLLVLLLHPQVPLGARPLVAPQAPRVPGRLLGSSSWRPAPPQGQFE